MVTSLDGIRKGQRLKGAVHLCGLGTAEVVCLDTYPNLPFYNQALMVKWQDATLSKLSPEFDFRSGRGEEKMNEQETMKPEEKVEIHPVPYESVKTCKLCGKLLNGSAICTNCGK